MGLTKLWSTIVQEIDVPDLRHWRVIHGRWRMGGVEREHGRQSSAILQQLDLRRNSRSWNGDDPTLTKHLPECPDALPECCLWHRSSLCQSASNSCFADVRVLPPKTAPGIIHRPAAGVAMILERV